MSELRAPTDAFPNFTSSSWLERPNDGKFHLTLRNKESYGGEKKEVEPREYDVYNNVHI